MTRPHRWAARGAVLCALAALLVGCAANRDHGDGGTRAPEVQAFGALRAIFHRGQTGAAVGLDKLLPNPNLYAVGALSGLAGEVTVVGGRVFLAHPTGNDTARTDELERSDAAATLLVAAAVRSWREVVVKRAIRFAELDREIARLAAGAGLRTDQRIPFLIEGAFDDLHWHVIDGRRLRAGGSSHEDHLAAAVRQQRKRATATLIGFYSAHDQGVFTHMGSRTHVHCVVRKPLASGHVDHVDIPAGATIRFPIGP
ncbi:MAG: acetolactate decarboxylase [Planctomycetes bacterium]|nr:acetolactate decarboxylase [Planctomycetota bacterium]MCB9871445.1 acetolactate decarboxylase [Planctomycetota bacterium]